MIWVTVPVIAILAYYSYKAFDKWIKYKKVQMDAPLADEYVTRLNETEDALEAAHRRIENLESIVVSRLLEDPSRKETVNLEASEMIAQSAKVDQI